MKKDSIKSWGLLPHQSSSEMTPFLWKDQNLPTDPFLPFGLGRSYGDSCLTQSGSLLQMTGLNRLISFDDRTGILEAESGVSMDEILKFSVPRGWFPPVVPGTKFVTLGGAIANDIHGKNHHRSGSFGRHIQSFQLKNSHSELINCSQTENPEYFAASIGGLGLTGVILSAKIQLTPITSSYLDVEVLKLKSLNQYFEVSAESSDSYDYTVAWVDTLAKGQNLGRGLYIRGNFSNGTDLDVHSGSSLNIPFFFPGYALNSASVKLFNLLYYNKQFSKKSKFKQHYDPFFFPLDGVLNWNRIYGKGGFYQYQFVTPKSGAPQVIRQILELSSRAKQGSFLSVLKDFGSLSSPGRLSFPIEGTTLAMDFPNKGERTLQLFRQFDEVVLKSGGRIYPAKDARMSPEVFSSFSKKEWEDFLPYKDPNIESSFFKRVRS